jgi:hypothetical protein
VRVERLAAVTFRRKRLRLRMNPCDSRSAANHTALDERITAIRLFTVPSIEHETSSHDTDCR